MRRGQRDVRRKILRGKLPVLVDEHLKYSAFYDTECQCLAPPNEYRPTFREPEILRHSEAVRLVIIR